MKTPAREVMPGGRHTGWAVAAVLLCAVSGLACPALPIGSQVWISIDVGAAEQLETAVRASVAGSAVAISPDTVESLTIEFTDVAYLPAGADEENEASWRDLTPPGGLVDGPYTLDLMALPTEAEGSWEIGGGGGVPGHYRMVRLMVGRGEMVFKGPLTIEGVSIEAGTPYPVTIPSGSQAGIRVNVSFEVTDVRGVPPSELDYPSNAVYLVFTPTATFQNVATSGDGGLTLTPVIRER